jgi:hypothetical protein
LDLSGNTAQKKHATFSLAASLEALVLDDVRFGSPQGFFAIMKVALMSPSLKKLSLKTAGLSPEDLERGFRHIIRNATPEFDPAITDFGWDNNGVGPWFFLFLEKLKHLQVLSLNGSISGNDNGAELLSEYIANSTTLEELHVCGTCQRNLTGDNLLPIFDALSKYNRSITSVNVSHNHFSEDTFVALSKMLTDNRIITTFEFQDSQLRDFNVFETFVEELGERGAPLDLKIPCVDLEEMLLSQVMTKERFHEYVKMVWQIKKGNSEIALPPATVNRPSEVPVPRYRALDGGSGQERRETSVCPPVNEWDAAVPTIPSPDDEVILGEFRRTHTIEKLLALIKSQPIDKDDV